MQRSKTSTKPKESDDPLLPPASDQKERPKVPKLNLPTPDGLNPGEILTQEEFLYYYQFHEQPGQVAYKKESTMKMEDGDMKQVMMFKQMTFAGSPKFQGREGEDTFEKQDEEVNQVLVMQKAITTTTVEIEGDQRGRKPKRRGSLKAVRDGLTKVPNKVFQPLQIPPEEREPLPIYITNNGVSQGQQSASILHTPIPLTPHSQVGTPSYTVERSQNTYTISIPIQAQTPTKTVKFITKKKRSKSVVSKKAKSPSPVRARSNSAAKKTTTKITKTTTINKISARPPLHTKTTIKITKPSTALSTTRKKSHSVAKFSTSPGFSSTQFLTTRTPSIKKKSKSNLKIVKGQLKTATAGFGSTQVLAPPSPSRNSPLRQSISTKSLTTRTLSRAATPSKKMENPPEIKKKKKAVKTVKLIKKAAGAVNLSIGEIKMKMKAPAKVAEETTETPIQ